MASEWQTTQLGDVIARLQRRIAIQERTFGSSIKVLMHLRTLERR